MQAFWKYLRALWSDLVARLSGIASVVLSAIGASRRTGLPSWTFWVAAGICFLIASFRAWLKEHQALEAANAEIVRLGAPRFSEERRRAAQEQLAKLNSSEHHVLRELLIRGEMLESQATEYLESLKLGRLSGWLNSISSKTSFVNRDFVGQYRVNPTFKQLLEELLSSGAPDINHPSQM